MFKQLRYLSMASLGLTSISLIVGGILASSYVSADDSVVDEINITVPISCSLTGTGMNTHNAEIPNGTYRADIGTTTLKAFCNDNEGFAIYAAGYTGNEIGATNSNKLVGTNASSNATIVTGTATSAGSPDISNWAMKLTLGTDSGDTTGTNALTIDSAPNVDLPSQAEQSTPTASFSSYHVVPNEYVKVAHKNSATSMDETNGGVTLTTTYAAYISKTQAADTYSGQVIYTLVHPADHAAPVYLNPNADNISEVDYMQQFAVVSDANRNAIIASMIPEQQYTVRDSRDNKTYTIAKYSYAAPGGGYNAVKAGNYLSSCENSSCDSSLYDQLPTEWKTFVDSCLPAGDCNPTLWPNEYDVWMTQNLDLDIDSTKTYTNEDTDLGYNTTTGEYNAASWTPIRSTYAPTSTQTHEWCNGGTWNSQDGQCENNNTPESYDPGNLYWNSTESDVDDWDDYNGSCDWTTSTPVCDQSKNPISTYVSSTGTAQYHLGNYYNWAAALATNDSSAFNSSTLVEQSICPAGWTLPRIGDGEDTFYSLWNQYGFTSSSYNDANNNEAHDTNESALWTSPLYFATNGYFYGYLDGVGNGGGFWAPVPYGSDDARVAGFGVVGFVSASGLGDRSDGNSVRCILRPVVNSVSGGGVVVPVV